MTAVKLTITERIRRVLRKGPASLPTLRKNTWRWRVNGASIQVALRAMIKRGEVRPAKSAMGGTLTEARRGSRGPIWITIWELAKEESDGNR